MLFVDVWYNNVCYIIISWNINRRRLFTWYNQCSLFTRSIIYTVISTSNDETMSTTSSRVSSSRNLEKFLEKRFANVKLVPLDNEQDGQRLLRKLTEQKLTKPTKTCLRPYLFAQSLSYSNPNVRIFSPFIGFFFLWWKLI